MKYIFFKRRILAMLLPMMALTIATSCGKDDVIEPNNGNSINNGGDNNQQDQEIVVTVDANGKADGGHRFSRIDETNFYIDDIKYTAIGGNLEVTGYDKAFFQGFAKIISILKYDGRTLKVVGIAKKAFSECSALTSVIIGNGVESIGDLAFYECRNLASITIPMSIKKIDGAFNGCYNLKKVIVPDIASWCGISFAGGKTNGEGEIISSNNPLYYSHHLYSDETTEITTLVIPNGVTKIEIGSFFGCSSITTITIPNSVKDIGCYAFYGTAWFDNQPDGLVYAGRVAYTYKGDMPDGTHISINDGTLGIAVGTFGLCENLTSVTIPKSVTTIGDCAFTGCCNLTDVYCHATNPPKTWTYGLYSSVTGEYGYAFDALYIKEHTTLHVPAGSLDTYKTTFPWSEFKDIVAIPNN